MHYDGGCHCGNISLVFETDIGPSAMTILACQCGYCRKHGARATSDPSGQLTITVKQNDKLNRYSFGLKSAARQLLSNITTIAEKPALNGGLRTGRRHHCTTQTKFPTDRS